MEILTIFLRSPSLTFCPKPEVEFAQQLDALSSVPYTTLSQYEKDS